MPKLVLLSFLMFSGAVLAQETPAAVPADDFSPPPMVPVGPPPMPAPEPSSALVKPGTPSPPSTMPPPPAYMPQQQGSQYPYSPYGTPRARLDDKPPVEWGLMISESLFGMLTSAGVALIPYFLLLRPMVNENAVLGDPAVSTVIFVVIFSALPLAVSQTQLSLANGSRYYHSDMWPAALAGLGAQAAVLGLFFAFSRAPNAGVNGMLGQHQTAMSGRNEIFLLIGSIGIVPLVQMAVINLTKSPRMGQFGAVSRDREGRFALGMPALSPLVAQTRLGMSVGVQASLLNFSW